MVLHINVYDDKDTFINRQYYELKNANCNPGTFFKPKMALLASAKNPPALLAAGLTSADVRGPVLRACHPDWWRTEEGKKGGGEK